MSVRGACRGLALCALLLLGACGSSRSYVSRPGPYDEVPEEWVDILALARQAYEGGRLEHAQALLAGLARRDEKLIPVRAFLQDIELAMLVQGLEVGGLQAPPEDARAWLADVYQQRADANPTAERYVLAARMSEDADAALALLDQAEALDSGCIWVAYGRAWWNYSERRFPEAREALAAAFAIDPGHLPSMRLEATRMASSGETNDAIDVLELWLDRTGGDALVDPRLTAEARVDLAALRVLDNEPAWALEELEEVDLSLVTDRARAELVRAAALEARGDLSGALEAARVAQGLAPGDLLPLMQEALLLERTGADPVSERQAWERILAQAAAAREAVPEAGAADPTELDFQSLLIQLQARTQLERLQREEASAPLEP